MAQVVLTWGATIVQSLANSTCPERAKMMTSRKEVNHITHSKSATSWGRPGQVKVGRGQDVLPPSGSESPHHPSPHILLVPCWRGVPGKYRLGDGKHQREGCPAPRSSPSTA